MDVKMDSVLIFTITSKGQGKKKSKKQKTKNQQHLVSPTYIYPKAWGDNQTIESIDFVLSGSELRSVRKKKLGWEEFSLENIGVLYNPSSLVHWVHWETFT